MDIFAQTLRYLGSLIAEPIIRATLNLVCRAQRFTRTRIGSWDFWGPAEFLDLVDEASKRLELEDPGLLRSMTDRYTVIYSPQRVFSFSLWKYGGVSDSFMVWKAEGVLAAWIYLYFDSLAVTKGRWFLSAPHNSIKASKDAEAKTREWLITHQFPPELWQVFDGTT
jgi:hypothetical protein